MPPVRRSGFVTFGNSEIIKVHSQRVNGEMCSSEEKTDKFSLVTKDPDHEGMCYVWSIHRPAGKSRKMLCQRCRYFYTKDKQRWPFSGVPSMYYDTETNEVDVNFHQLKHFNECAPQDISKIRGISLRREIQNRVQYVGIKSATTAVNQLEKEITIRYAALSPEKLHVIRDAAKGNTRAVYRAMARSKSLRYPKIVSFPQLNLRKHVEYSKNLAADCPDYKGDTSFLRYADEDYALYISPTQLQTLKRSKKLKGDGSFKFAPKGSRQIYRLFGCVRKTKWVPVATFVMRQKSKIIYKKVFDKIKEIVGGEDGIAATKIHFDYEVGCINAFKEVFPNVQPKLCTFHSQQGIMKYVNSNGLKPLYKKYQFVKTWIKRMGALQHVNPELLDTCIGVIKSSLRNTTDAAEELPRSTLSNLKRVFSLYCKNWIDGPCGRDFYSAYDVTKNRTTNHAENYHSRQRLYFENYRMPLGEWVVQFREMTNAEDNEVTSIRMRHTDPPVIEAETEKIDERIAKYKAKLDEKLLGKEEELSAEAIAAIVKKYLRKIGGYLKWIDTLDDEESESQDQMEEEILTAFEETDDEE